MAKERNTSAHGPYVMPPPKAAARALPERARRDLYQKFQAHTDEVLNTFLDILRDDEVNASDRIAAGKEILNRGWGQAPNVSLVDATLKVEHTVSMDALRQMSTEELASVEGLLMKLVGNESPPHAIIDAEVLPSNESADHAFEATTNESADHASEPPAGPPRRRRRA